MDIETKEDDKTLICSKGNCKLDHLSQLKSHGTDLQSISITLHYRSNVLDEGIEHIKSLKNLQFTYGSFNSISNLIIFTNLQTLSLDSNKIKDIPSDINKLINLQKLTLNSNYIENVPDELWQLYSLHELVLSHNHIKVISNKISSLIELKKLILRFNVITEIPIEIGKLLKLEIIDFSYNCINDLPPSIYNLKNLKTLHFNGNFITKLPIQIYHMYIKGVYMGMSFETNKLLGFPHSFRPCIFVTPNSRPSGMIETNVQCIAKNKSTVILVESLLEICLSHVCKLGLQDKIKHIFELNERIELMLLCDDCKMKKETHYEFYYLDTLETARFKYLCKNCFNKNLYH